MPVTKWTLRILLMVGVIAAVWLIYFQPDERDDPMRGAIRRPSHPGGVSHDGEDGTRPPFDLAAEPSGTADRLAQAAAEPDAASATAEVTEHGRRIFDPLRDGPRGGVLWGVGRLDGRPADETDEIVADEYGLLRCDSEVVTIRPYDRWTLMTAPFVEWNADGRGMPDFHVWPDQGMRRDIELELNGFMALYSHTPDGREYVSSRAATVWDKDGTRMRLLIEAPSGRPTAQLLRLERPARIAQARVSEPSTVRGVSIVHRDLSQLLEIVIPEMPDAGDEARHETIRATFPNLSFRPEMGYVMIELELER